MLLMRPILKLAVVPAALPAGVPSASHCALAVVAVVALALDAAGPQR